jgi:hypothetical protein
VKCKHPKPQRFRSHRITHNGIHTTEECLVCGKAREGERPRGSVETLRLTKFGPWRLIERDRVA